MKMQGWPLCLWPCKQKITALIGLQGQKSRHFLWMEDRQINFLAFSLNNQYILLALKAMKAESSRKPGSSPYCIKRPHLRCWMWCSSTHSSNWRKKKYFNFSKAIFSFWNWKQNWEIMNKSHYLDICFENVFSPKKVCLRRKLKYRQNPTFPTKTTLNLIFTANSLIFQGTTIHGSI